MNSKLKLITLITMITVTISSTGCSILFKKEEPPVEEPKIVTPDTNPEEDNKVREEVEKYFQELYGNPVDSYAQNIVSGSIPDNIKGFIAKKTIDEANNNPEIGIHLPRIVELNGLNITDYEILKDKDGKLYTETNFIGSSDDKFIYFVKVNLKGKVLENSIFDQNYQRNSMSGIYERINTIDENLFDYIKVQAKYDVEVVKEESGYKILVQKEADEKPGLKNRLFKLNNEFMERIAYFDMNIPDEQKIYEEEKTLIEGVFKNFENFDKERMKLLKVKWDTGKQDFADFASMIGITKVQDKDVLFIDDSYKTKFNFESFPLKTNMEKIKSFENVNISVDVHPGYSYKNKRYFVSFEVPVIMSNGMIGEEVIYKYDYYVTLKSADGKLLVDSIKLNECYKAK